MSSVFWVEIHQAPLQADWQVVNSTLVFKLFQEKYATF
jgi:hypothetical protein